MRAFIWRLFKQGFVVQVALTVLLASAIALFAIYNSYIARETSAMNRRIENKANPQGFYLIAEAKTRPNTDTTTRDSLRLYTFVAAWYKAVTPSNLGHLPITYIDTTNGTLHLDDNVAAIHESVAHRLGLRLGDELTLYRQDTPLTVKIIEVFPATPFDLGIDLGEAVLVHTGESEENLHFLYQQTGIGALNISRTKASVLALHSPGSTITSFYDADPMGAMIVRSNYNVVAQAKFSLLLLLTLAFLTAKLLSYMDIRRMLAILKALGLRNNQVCFTILAEAALSPLFGVLLGGATSTVILKALNSAGYNMPYSPLSIFIAIVMVFPAVALGVMIPARFAQVSNVNELLYERQVPLFTESVDRVLRHYPQLDFLVKSGVHLIRLNVSSGEFEGFIFRRLSDTVQTGEVIAHERRWWGLQTVDYCSPVTGTIVYFDEHTGMIGIQPAIDKR